jgi:hypothetical protein
LIGIGVALLFNIRGAATAVTNAARRTGLWRMRPEDAWAHEVGTRLGLGGLFIACGIALFAIVATS